MSYTEEEIFDEESNNNLIKKFPNYIKDKCKQINKYYHINEKHNIRLCQKINNLESEFYNEFEFYYCSKILEELFLLYYDKYNIENIIYKNMNKLFEKKNKKYKFNINEIIPLRIYDSKEHRIIIGY
jgi:hypothetical protein